LFEKIVHVSANLCCVGNVTPDRFCALFKMDGFPSQRLTELHLCDGAGLVVALSLLSEMERLSSLTLKLKNSFSLLFSPPAHVKQLRVVYLGQTNTAGDFRMTSKTLEELVLDDGKERSLRDLLGKETSFILFVCFFLD
jgi:hypothetical protein